MCTGNLLVLVAGTCTCCRITHRPTCTCTYYMKYVCVGRVIREGRRLTIGMLIDILTVVLMSHVS